MGTYVILIKKKMNKIKCFCGKEILNPRLAPHVIDVIGNIKVLHCHPKRGCGQEKVIGFVEDRKGEYYEA